MNSQSLMNYMRAVFRFELFLLNLFNFLNMNPMNTNPNPTKETRIVWLDLLRFVAILLVISTHCTDPLNASMEARSNPECNFWGSAFGSLARPCVPLFVMITGMLLLPIKQGMSAFYKKRIPRVLFPFIIWSILFNLAPWFIQWAGGSQELVVQFFPWEPNPSDSFSDALITILQIPVNFTVFATPMWYIYMLIGLYLYMPIFSAWVEKASDKAKRFFLYLWGISLFIPYLMVFFNKYVFGTCSWNGFGVFYYFAGFNGYLLLGHYLGKAHTLHVRKLLGLCIPMLIIGYLTTFFGFRFMTADPSVTEEGMELFFTYCSPNVVLMTIPIFLLIKQVKINSQRIRRILKNLTTCGFGIYCAHYFFIGPSYMFACWLNTPIVLRVPVATLLTFVCTWAVVYLLSKLPKAKYLIG